jgi:hypothetical protein
MLGQESWDISFLVDQDARILEGRGACSEHLGETLQSLIGRPLTTLVVERERKYLRRFLAQLDRPKGKRAVVVTLQSLRHGNRSYAMRAQPGRSPQDHWLLFGHSDHAGENFDDLALPPAMVDDGQFLRLVEMAAAQVTEALELTSIKVGGLSHPDRLAGHNADQRAAFERGIGEVLSAQAHEGIVSNPSPGFFNLLHDPSQPGQAIAADLASVARRHGISDNEAAIAHVSQSVLPNASAESVRQSLRNMEARLPGGGWETPPARHTSEGQLAAWLGIGAFLLGVIGVAAWMLL